MCTHYPQSCQYFPVKQCFAPGVACNDRVVSYTVVLKRLISVFKVSRECQNVKKNMNNEKTNNESLRLAVLMSLSIFWCVILVLYFTVLAQLFQLVINIRYSLLS